MAPGAISMGSTDSAAANWQRLFADWPAEMPRRAVVVTTYDEQIPFSGFQTGEGFLLLERNAPDSLGARMVVLPYQQIVALKLTEVVKSRSLRALGFAKTSSTE
jgi:hypothetical protein